MREALERMIAAVEADAAILWQKRLGIEGDAYRKQGMERFKGLRALCPPRSGEGDRDYLERLLLRLRASLATRQADPIQAAWELAPILGAIEVERGRNMEAEQRYGN